MRVLLFFASFLTVPPATGYLAVRFFRRELLYRFIALRSLGSLLLGPDTDEDRQARSAQSAFLFLSGLGLGAALTALAWGEEQLAWTSLPLTAAFLLPLMFRKRPTRRQTIGEHARQLLYWSAAVAVVMLAF